MPQTKAVAIATKKLAIPSKGIRKSLNGKMESPHTRTVLDETMSFTRQQRVVNADIKWYFKFHGVKLDVSGATKKEQDKAFWAAVSEVGKKDKQDVIVLRKLSDKWEELEKKIQAEQN